MVQNSTLCVIFYELSEQHRNTTTDNGHDEMSDPAHIFGNLEKENF